MKTSPLNDRHIALNAKMADFGGWLMPIEYPGGGVLAEHTAVREAVGIFDVSHLGKASVIGPDAVDFLNSMFTNDLNRIANGCAQYTLLCTPDGGVVDDLMAYRNASDNVFLVPNAANTSAVVEVLQAHAPASISVIALQGPLVPQVMQELGIYLDIEYMAFSQVKILDTHVLICRTGYTGEFGYELLPATADASKIWDALVAVVDSLNGLVCGLGARDTLRTEMGYPLHGHELSLEISPVQAGASWAIGWDKDSFIGSENLKNEKTNGPTSRTVALRSLDRGIPRGGMSVKNTAGELVGTVTSGTFSPTLKVGIGIALLKSGVKVGDQLLVDVRGRDSHCEVVKLPFVASHVR